MEIWTGILSKKVSLNRACRNHYLSSGCTLITMIHEMMPWATCCKKFILNEWKWIKARFRINGFVGIRNKLQSQWEFQIISLEILGYHNQRWRRNLPFQTFPVDYFVKKGYRVVKILHKYNRLRRNNSLLYRAKHFLLCLLRKALLL